MPDKTVPDFDNTEIYWWRPLHDEPEPDTRAKILFAAYKEIHLHGFQSASLNAILAHTGVTKGALYHHFPNKTELGYAVIEEVIADRILRSFIAPLENSNDPMQALIDLIQGSAKAFTLRDIQLGCPLGNLAQEMAAIDEGFRVRLNRIYGLWHAAIMGALKQAQDSGRIIPSINPESVAVMVVATMEGCLSAAKISQDLNRLFCCGEGLIQYLMLIQNQR
jgi:AcrR family transcriptional regulator